VACGRDRIGEDRKHKGEWRVGETELGEKIEKIRERERGGACAAPDVGAR